MTDARRARAARRPGALPVLALDPAVQPAALRAAGWHVAGSVPLSPRSPYEPASAPDLPSYDSLADVLADPRVDAVALDGAGPEAAAVLPALRRAGLLVLLAQPAPLDLEAVRAAARVDGPEVAVAFTSRAQPWARTVGAALRQVAAPPVQVTVRGWPPGERAAAELAHLAALWCGEVVSVSGSAQALPAAALPDGARVEWALLAESGAVVLVSPDRAPGQPPGPLVRVSLPSARLEAGPGGVRWTGGSDLPLADAGPAEDAGLRASAAALVRCVGGGTLDAAPPPGSAALGDLLAAARVLEALRESARRRLPVRTG